MSDPSVTAGDVPPIAPDRMTLVDDWRHGAAMVELYADAKHGDGYLIVFESYAPEQAASITEATGHARIAWAEGFIDRAPSWRRELAAAVRHRLAMWERP